MSGWKQSSQETMLKAQFIFEMLTGVADSPQEAAEMMTAMYVSLWLSGKAEDSSLDKALVGFCNCIKMNVELTEGKLRGELQ